MVGFKQGQYSDKSKVIFIDLWHDLKADIFYTEVNKPL